MLNAALPVFDELPRRLRASNASVTNAEVARHDRARVSEVGSELWWGEVDDLRQRIGALERRPPSRADSGSSSRRRESIQTPNGQRLPDRTVRSSRASTAFEDSPDVTSNRTRSIQEPNSGSIRRSRTTMEHGSPYANDSPLARSQTIGATARSASRIQTPDATRSPDIHYRLLNDALHYFCQQLKLHPVGSANAPEIENDLVLRLNSLSLSTARLNTDLRELVTATMDAQAESELDETANGIAPGLLARLEKAANQLVRVSDEQVRSLTEGLIAFARVERERERIRGDSSQTRSIARNSPRVDSPRIASPTRVAERSPEVVAALSRIANGANSRPGTASGTRSSIRSSRGVASSHPPRTPSDATTSYTSRRESSLAELSPTLSLPPTSVRASKASSTSVLSNGTVRASTSVAPPSRYPRSPIVTTATSHTSPGNEAPKDLASPPGRYRAVSNASDGEWEPYGLGLQAEGLSRRHTVNAMTPFSRRESQISEVDSTAARRRPSIGTTAATAALRMATSAGTFTGGRRTSTSDEPFDSGRDVQEILRSLRQ